MKVALLSTPICEQSLRTLKYFEKFNEKISLIIIETGQRKHYTERERQFRHNHDKYNRKFRKYAWYRRTARFFWDFIPTYLQDMVKNQIVHIPLFRKFSIEYQARKRGIPVKKVKRHSSSLSKKYLQKYQIKYALLMSSQWLIKDPLLSMDVLSIINVHPGFLPKHRGLDSLPWSILEGDPIGLTAYILDEGVDSGPILEFYPMKVKKGDTIGLLQRRMNKLIPKLLLSVLYAMENGEIYPTPQTEKMKLHRPMTFSELEMAESLLQQRF
ncbi:MAG: hypothetical protein K9N46_13430 [Candidatus Marinimicrobia bacterium]|nr:hypothetical protein [Candidatus Neomarinimicrobiota bacterium]MCF7829834.1 hypothetical protein [Candidatus Neomarinimicrobiota bacterium]MCF7881733.1 hypothetical protein [Candidatus Neomarinimicrobiota bacterium]MCF8232840.1 hypothetical protein [Bacteroidales bacterium]